MNAKLKKISEWTARGIKIGMRGYQYAPINSKNHFARGRDEFVIWCERDEGDFTQGILWARGEECAFIPFPEAEKGWNNPVLIDSDSDVLVIDGNGEKVWSISSPKNAPCEVKCENWCLANSITEISTSGENGSYPVICRVDGEVYAANSFTFFNYHAETCTLQWKPQLHYVFSDEKIKERFQRALDEVNGEHHKMAFRYSYPQIGSVMIKDCSIYAFLEANIINPCTLSQFKYYWYVEITEDGVYKRKIWGRERLEKLPGKQGMRGKFSADKEYLILSPVFKTDEWKGKQKLLRLSDGELINVTLPRGYSKFRVMDVREDRVFISDEVNRIAVCEMAQ